MSHGLAPSKSTVYVSNLPFTLTNNDIHKIFEKFGKIVRVTILKDKKTRESKGVAFILFLTEEEAKNCVSSYDRQQLGGRTIRTKIAADNGRSTEFIRKRFYEDKSKCYECGETGHLSYECPSNTLGIRKPPPKKKKKRKISNTDSLRQKEKLEYFESSEDEYTSSVPKMQRCYNDSDNECKSSEDIEDPSLETLGAVIRMEQEKEAFNIPSSGDVQSKKRIRKSSYFSDEEELSE